MSGTIHNATVETRSVAPDTHSFVEALFPDNTIFIGKDENSQTVSPILNLNTITEYKKLTSKWTVYSTRFSETSRHLP